MLIALLSTSCLFLVILSIIQQLKLRELRQGEEAFRTLAENSSDLIMRYDQDCRRLYVNPVVARLFGKSVEEIIGQTPVDSEFLTSEQNRKVFDGIRRVFETGETVGVEVVFTDEEGRSFDYSILLIPERDTEGKVKTVLGLSRDITKRKRAEQDLKQALEFTEGIINAIPDLLFELDLNGRYLNIWAQNPTLLAAKKEVLLGNTVHDVLLPDAAEIAMAAIEEADRKGYSFGKVIRVVLPQGESWFELSVSRKPGPSQTDRRFIGLSRDVTKRKRLQDDLTYSRNFFNRIIDTVADPIFVKDRQHRWIHLNEASCRLFGGTRKELIGKSDFDFFPEHEARAFWEGDETVFTGGKEFAAEEEITNKQGEKRYIFTRKTTFIDNHGRPILVGVISDITERKRMADELADSQNFLDRIINATIDPIFVKDRQHRWILVNNAFCHLVGGKREELIGKSDFEFFPEEEARLFWEGDELVFTEGNEFSREEEITTKGGEKRYIFTRKRMFYDVHGTPNLTGVITDITERKRMELQLTVRERELRTLLEHIPDNIARYTPDACHMYLNPVTERTTGKSNEFLYGRTPMECFPDGRYSEYEQRVLATAASGGYEEMEMAVLMPDGETQTHFIRFIAERDEKGEVVSVLTIGTDITLLKKHEQQLERIAHHDPLTGLPNRLLFMDRLNQAVAQTRRAGGLLAVCFADLDGFKPVNDQYGHAAGDLVLVKVANRMKESVRDSDTVGRIGGDEFVVVLLNLENVQECETILTRLLEAVAQPIMLDGHSVSVTTSLGVALFPQDDSDPDRLLQHADMAMYQAKQDGQNIYRFFEPDRP